MEYIESSSATALHSFINFAEFVAQTEFLADEESEEFKEQYGRAWFEMELVNSLALAEWEQDGCPREWGKIWGEKYKEEAKETLHEFLEVVKKWPD
ncbi:hypothetical protein [Billgrantia montanilacus]|nr:hypothetical protein [Halomonas montanilacus]